jgi:hypothetical protein
MFGRFVKAALADRGLTVRQLAKTLNHRHNENPFNEKYSEHMITSIIEDRRWASMSCAWHVSQALRMLGVRWANGMTGLCVAHFPEHFFGVAGWLMVDGFTDELKSLWTLLTHAPYNDHIHAILNPFEFEDRIAGRNYMIYEGELLAGRAELIEGETSAPSFFALRAEWTAGDRIEFLEQITIGEQWVSVLDHAFELWCNGNERKGRVPYALAEIIDVLDSDSSAPPHKIVADAAWDEFLKFVRSVEHVEQLPLEDREKYRLRIYRKTDK